MHSCKIDPEKMKFNKALEENHPERLIDQSGNCLDILPFGRCGR